MAQCRASRCPPSTQGRTWRAPAGCTARRHCRRLTPHVATAAAACALSAQATAALAASQPLPPCWHHSALPHPLLAAVVPEFPRIGGQVVRDWIGAAVETLPGFNGDDLARLLLPDLVGLVDGPTFLIGATLALAVIYWEGGVLLRQLRQRREAARRQRQRGPDDGDPGSGAGGVLGSWEGGPVATDDSGWAAGGGLSGAAEQQQQQQADPALSRMDRARHERRRGLGWLALVTAICIWMTGVVSGPSPFQP